MNILKIPAKTKYRIVLIAGIALVPISISVFMDAYEQKDNSKLFMRGLASILWLGYAANHIIQYKKKSSPSV